MSPAVWIECSSVEWSLNNDKGLIEVLGWWLQQRVHFLTIWNELHCILLYFIVLCFLSFLYILCNISIQYCTVWWCRILYCTSSQSQLSFVRLKHDQGTCRQSNYFLHLLHFPRNKNSWNTCHFPDCYTLVDTVSCISFKKKEKASKKSEISFCRKQITVSNTKTRRNHRLWWKSAAVAQIKE